MIKIRDKYRRGILVNKNFSKNRISKMDSLTAYILPVLVSVGDYIAIVIAEAVAFYLCVFIEPKDFYMDIPKSYFLSLGACCIYLFLILCWYA